MAVEDLGLNVFVKGFKEFDNQMKAMDKSIDQLGEEWEDVDKASRKAAKGTDEATKATKKASKAQQILQGALRAVGEGIVGFVKDLPRMAVELAKAGAASLRQSAALDNLAKSAGTSGGEIVTAIQEASSFTIDKMTAMSAANKAMLLDVAKSPAQFEKLTKVAVSLGRAMGQDAAKSIDDFVVAAGRQSIMIADNLGLTIKVGEANEAYAKKLGISVNAMDSAQKKQAFLNAMLEAGEVKMAELGEGGLDAAGSLERFEARASDLKIMLGEKLAPVLAGITDMLYEEMTRIERINKAYDELTDRVVITSDSYDQYIKRLIEVKEKGSRSEQFQAKQAKTMLAAGKSIEEVAKELGWMTEAEWEAATATDKATKAQEEAEVAAKDATKALTEQRRETAKFRNEVRESTDGMLGLTDGMDDALPVLNKMIEETGELTGLTDGLGNTFEITARDTDKLTKSLKEVQAEAFDMKEAALDMGMTWKSYYDDVEGKAEEFAETREEIEATHQENLAALLEEQLTAQGLTMQDYYDGRLVIQDENVADALAKEKERYAGELKELNEGMAAQELAQRQALGRMVLQAFTSWATMKGIPEGKMLEMKIAIAKEYGLIDANTETSVESMLGSWEEWSKGFDEDATTVIGRMDDAMVSARIMKEVLEKIPRRIDIDINVNQRWSSTGERTVGPGLVEGFQHGTPFVPRTGLALLHRGEMVLPRSVATMLRRSGGNTTNITNQGAQNNFNFTAQSLMQPGQMQMEFSTMAMAMRNR